MKQKKKESRYQSVCFWTDHLWNQSAPGGGHRHTCNRLCWQLGRPAKRIQYQASPVSLSHFLFIFTVYCYCLHGETSGSLCLLHESQRASLLPCRQGFCSLDNSNFTGSVLTLCSGEFKVLRCNKTTESIFQIRSFIYFSEHRKCTWRHFDFRIRTVLCIHRSIKESSSFPEKKVLMPGCYVPEQAHWKRLPWPLLKPQIWLARKEQSIGEEEYILVSCLSVPGLALTRCTSQELAFWAQWKLNGSH